MRGEDGGSVSAALPLAERRLLRDTVYDSLRAAILSGALAPGQRIQEMDVAASMRVSQAPVREALRRLQQEGLVITFPHKGTFVTTVSEAEMEEVYALRALLEEFAVRRVCGRLAAQDLDLLAAFVEAMRAAARAGDQAALIDADMRFHEHVCRLAGASTLLQVWSILDARVRGFISVTNLVYFDLGEIAEWHPPLLEALRGRDPDAAAARFRAHIYEVWHRIRAGLAASGRRAAAPAPAGRVPTARAMRGGGAGPGSAGSAGTADAAAGGGRARRGAGRPRPRSDRAPVP